MLNLGKIGSREFSLKVTGLFTLVVFITVGILYHFTGPWMVDNQSSPLQMAVAFLLCWGSLYGADRINTNKPRITIR